MSHDLRIHAAELCGCGAVLYEPAELAVGLCTICRVQTLYLHLGAPRAIQLGRDGQINEGLERLGRRTGLSLAQLREGRES